MRLCARSLCGTRPLGGRVATSEAPTAFPIPSPPRARLDTALGEAPRAPLPKGERVRRRPPHHVARTAIPTSSTRPPQSQLPNTSGIPPSGEHATPPQPHLAVPPVPAARNAEWMARCSDTHSGFGCGCSPRPSSLGGRQHRTRTHSSSDTDRRCFLTDRTSRSEGRGGGGAGVEAGERWCSCPVRRYRVPHALHSTGFTAGPRRHWGDSAGGRAVRAEAESGSARLVSP